MVFTKQTSNTHLGWPVLVDHHATNVLTHPIGYFWRLCDIAVLLCHEFKFKHACFEVHIGVSVLAVLL